jgi:hypothetical protein
MLKKIIKCRRTGMGALTHVVDYSDGVEVREFAHSRTGNHWSEEITFPSPDSWVLVKDISNSGKHSCYRLYGDGRYKTVCSPHEPPQCE